MAATTYCVCKVNKKMYVNSVKDCEFVEKGALEV